jgi:hypothetical protein
VDAYVDICLLRDATFSHAARKISIVPSVRGRRERMAKAGIESGRGCQKVQLLPQRDIARYYPAQ